MFAAIRHRIFRAFGDWAIQRAMRTPYTHLFHDDGRPYMQRFWLLRIGMPKGWRQMEREMAKLESDAGFYSPTGPYGRFCAQRVDELRQKLYPRFGIRIHRIMSSDDRAFHDHPFNFITLILRGGYTEFRPTGFQPHQVTVASDYDGSAPVTYTESTAVRYSAGRLLRRKAESWHYLILDQGVEAWTMFCTGKKRQTWGFLVDGLLKVPYRIYLERRADRAQNTAKETQS